MPAMALGKRNLKILNPPNRRIRDPYVRWCGRRGAVRLLPTPIRRDETIDRNYQRVGIKRARELWQMTLDCGIAHCTTKPNFAGSNKPLSGFATCRRSHHPKP
jgi:hypothetical protein